MSEPATAVLDRIVDGETAVLLVEAGCRTTDQCDVAVERLPVEGRHEGAVFEVAVEDGTLVEATYLPAETSDRRRAAQDRLDRLSERLPDE